MCGPMHRYGHLRRRHRIALLEAVSQLRARGAVHEGQARQVPPPALPCPALAPHLPCPALTHCAAAAARPTVLCRMSQPPRHRVVSDAGANKAPTFVGLVLEGVVGSRSSSASRPPALDVCADTVGVNPYYVDEQQAADEGGTMSEHARLDLERGEDSSIPRLISLYDIPSTHRYPRSWGVLMTDA